jgi:cell wall-associated NlpC family hydrolase
LTQRRSAALAVAVCLTAPFGLFRGAQADTQKATSLTLSGSPSDTTEAASSDSEAGQDALSQAAPSGIAPVASRTTLATSSAAGESPSALPAPSHVRHYHRRRRAHRTYSQVSRSITSVAPDGITVVGRLGVVTADTTQIVGGRDRYGRILSVCQKGTNLAISGETDTQYAVLMVDRTVGYVDKSDVQLLDYQVVSGDPASDAAGAGGTALGSQLVQTAYTYLNVPYVWGGNDRDGIDCSGFVKAVFAQYGITLPRHSGDQAAIGLDVPRDRVDLWQPGDRMYFACHSPDIDHTAMYIGSGYFIHASAGHGHQVAIDRVDNAYYYSHLVCVRRSPELMQDASNPSTGAQPNPDPNAADTTPTPESGPAIETIRGTVRTMTRPTINDDAGSTSTAANDVESSQE